MAITPTPVEVAAGTRLAPSPAARRRWVALRSYLWPESGAVSPIPALDGLRAVAVLMVVIHHAWLFIPGIDRLVPDYGSRGYPMYYGRTGVQLFFVLSGFLLFLPYARWMFSLQSRPSTRLFYKRRILRVGPAYWVALTIMFLLTPLTLGSVGNYVIHLAFLSNFAASSIMGFNPVFWTMSVEVQFYLILPLLGWILASIARRWSPLIAVAVLLAGSSLVSLTSDLLAHPGTFNYPYISTGVIGIFTMFFYLAVFSAGMLCAVLYVYLRQVAGVAASSARKLTWSGLIVFTLGLAGTLYLITPKRHVHFDSQLIGYTYAAILFGVLFGPSLTRRPFEWRWMRFTGLISYSIYLWHVPVMQAMTPLLLPHSGVYAMFAERIVLGGIVLTFIVAYMSYQLVERPFFSARKQAHDLAARTTTAIAQAAI